MKSKVVFALVALNVLLLAALIGQWVKPNTAVAQTPRPSDYLLIQGTVQGSQTEVVYMIDTQNGWLSARTFDGQRMVDMAPINLGRLFNGNVGPGTPRRGRY